MTEEELRKAKWLVADAVSAVLAARSEYPAIAVIDIGIISSSLQQLETLAEMLRDEEPDADS